MFQGYKTTADSNFVKYLNKKEEDYIDGITKTSSLKR